MKGFAVIEPGKVGWIEVEKPVAGPLDAVLKPIAVGVCSSDTHVSDGGAGPMKNRILGHEAVAEVVEVGNLVKRFKPGDKVVVNCVTPDWEQLAVQERYGNNTHDAGFASGFKFLMSKDGVWADFFHVNNADANLVLMPEDVSLEDALMTTDMMSTGFYASEMADIQFGDTVVIYGIGPVGLMALAGTALRGAGHIIGIGSRPNLVKLAKEFGATDIIDYHNGDVVQQIVSKYGQVDKCIIAGGNCSAMADALKMVRPNGIISNVNFYDGMDTFNIPAPLWGLGMSDVTIRGGFCPGGAKRIERLLKLIQTNRIHPGKVLNMKFEGFENLPKAFQAMHDKPKELIKSYVIL